MKSKEELAAIFRSASTKQRLEVNVPVRLYHGHVYNIVDIDDEIFPAVEMYHHIIENGLLLFRIKFAGIYVIDGRVPLESFVYGLVVSAKGELFVFDGLHAPIVVECLESSSESAAIRASATLFGADRLAAFFAENPRYEIPLTLPTPMKVFATEGEDDLDWLYDESLPPDELLMATTTAPSGELSASDCKGLFHRVGMAIRRCFRSR